MQIVQILGNACLLGLLMVLMLVLPMVLVLVRGMLVPVMVLMVLVFAEVLIWNTGNEYKCW